jgi:general secretion pathway protein J
MNWSISRLLSSRDSATRSGGRDASQRTSCSAGFTLVEILIAISILAILMTSVYGIFSSVSLARGRLEADSADYHRARVIFDRMGRELRGAYFQTRDQNLVFSGGISEESSASLELTTTAVSPLSQKGSGLARIRYLLLPDPEDGGRSRVLMRSEQAVYDPEPIQGTQGMMRLAPGVEAMSIRFYGNGQWVEKWDGAASGMPEMVEISLQLHREGSDPIFFVSAFEIPTVAAR